MKLTNSVQMREIDKYVIDNQIVSGAELMLNAAGHIASAVMEELPLDGHVAVFCGAGNNGGDGVGAAAYLLEKGVSVDVFFVGNADKLTPDFKEMQKRLEEAGGSLAKFSVSDELEELLSNCDVIIDAIFGTGLNAELRGDALRAAEIINASHARVIAADIASGVNADTGEVLGDAVKADMTVTFSLAKPGHFIEPGGTRCGELRVCDIGIPRDIIDNAASRVFSVMPGDVSLPRRKPDTHKGDYGRCLIIAGSVGYTGAPALCARAASRMGAGLVFLGVPESIYDVMAIKLDEEMPFPLPDNGYGRIAPNAAGEIVRRASECDVCLIGPGLGKSQEITDLLTSIVQLVKTPVVLDADGLNAAAENIDIISKAVCPLILTPHQGEFIRLGGDLTSGDRLNAARLFARKHGCVLVLKGHRTISAFPDGTAYINTTGGPSMAKGGSGDVLAGMIAALIGQKIPFKEAVTTAVYVHGLSGDLCAAGFGDYSVVASDIVAMLPKAAKKIEV